jgi:hypothetical protein
MFDLVRILRDVPQHFRAHFVSVRKRYTSQIGALINDILDGRASNERYLQDSPIKECSLPPLV